MENKKDDHAMRWVARGWNIFSIGVTIALTIVVTVQFVNIYRDYPDYSVLQAVFGSIGLGLLLLRASMWLSGLWQARRKERNDEKALHGEGNDALRGKARD